MIVLFCLLEYDEIFIILSVFVSPCSFSVLHFLFYFPFRIFAYTMQHYVLSAFKKVLRSSPSLVDVFRVEGVWDFIFSENFFYFGPAPAEFSGENSWRKEVSLMDDAGYCDSSFVEDRVNANSDEVLQAEIISFMEFAATLSGISHNLVGCSFCV